MSRPSSVTQEVVLDRMRSVFRANGYEGTSLADLARATGLAKAGLYHRFPEGKVRMARAVLEDLRHWSVGHLLAPLREPGDPRQRLERFVAALGELYHEGHEACLLGAFSNGEALGVFGVQLHQAITDLMDALAALMVDAGVVPERAARLAEDTVVRIQGSLVVSRLLGNTGPFVRVTDDLVDTLLGDAR